MKKYIVFVKFIFLFAVVVFLYAFTGHRNSRKTVVSTGIEFSNGDNLFLSHAMVNKLLIQKEGPLKNKAKSLINLHNLESDVCSNPLVESAVIYMTIGGSLKAVVTQRTPVARVQTSEQVYYLDRQGLKMPLSPSYSASVLLVSGAVTDRDLPDVFQLVVKIRKDSFLKKNIVGIQKKSDGTFVLKTRMYKQQIQLGEIVNLDQKFKKLEAFYNKAILDKEIETYKTIDLKYNNQVVCTKK